MFGNLPLLAVNLGIAEERGAYSYGVGSIFILFLVGGILLAATRRDGGPTDSQGAA